MRDTPRLRQGGVLELSSWNGRVAPTLDANFRELQILPGIGYTLKKSAGGVSLVIQQQSASKPPTNPFDIIPSVDSSGSTAINLWAGSVNGIMPTNMFDSFTVDDTSLWYAKATVDTDGSAVTEVTINVDTSAPDVQHSADGELPSGFDVILGLYKAGMIYNIAGGNVTLTATQAFNLGYWAVS